MAIRTGEGLESLDVGLSFYCGQHSVERVKRGRDLPQCHVRRPPNRPQRMVRPHPLLQGQVAELPLL
jgi:hypothetical protein